MRSSFVNKLIELLSEAVATVDAMDAKLIKLATQSKVSPLSPNAAKAHLDRTKQFLSKLPAEVILYRVIFVNRTTDIDKTKIGSHYVMKLNQLEQNHHSMSHVGGGSPFVLMVKAPRTLVDMEATLKNRMEYPHEEEITLKNKGVGAKIMKIEPFRPKKDDKFDIGRADDFDFGGYDTAY